MRETLKKLQNYNLASSTIYFELTTKKNYYVQIIKNEMKI